MVTRNLSTFKRKLNSFMSGRLLPSVFYFLLGPLIILAPQLLAVLIGNKGRNRYLPRVEERLVLTPNPMDDFIVVPFTGKSFDEVNIILRGQSLDLEEVNKELPSFFVNATDLTGLETFKNKWLATGDIVVLSQILGLSTDYEPFGDSTPFHRLEIPLRDSAPYALKTGNWRVYFAPGPSYIGSLYGCVENDYQWIPVRERIAQELADINHLSNQSDLLELNELDYDCSLVIHKSGLTNIQLGSALGLIIALLHSSKKVNIYGWDQYMSDKIPSDFYNQIKVLAGNRSRYIGTTITCLVNWIYAFRLLESLGDKLSVSGNISTVVNLDWLPKRAYRILYK